MKNGVTPVNLAGTVKRNLAVLAFTQALITIIVQTFVVHVPVTIILLGGSATLAGLGTAFMWGGRLVTTYQMGRLMDMVGRMPVVMAGMALLAVSAAAAGLSALQHLLVPYLVVLVLFGIGRGMADNSRIAAGDMLPPEKRGLGTGFLLTGSLAGTLAATPMIAAVYTWAGEDSIAAAYFATIPFAAAGFLSAFSVRPDPLQIARMHLHGNPRRAQPQARGLREIMTPTLIFAYASSAITTGVMVAFMSLASLLLHTHDIPISIISLVVTIHVIGMYAFSVPLGRAADMLGRVLVTVSGVVVCAVGAYITAVGGSLPLVTPGMFLVGVGWSAATVGSLALISDETAPEERGKALGLNDTSIALASLATPILASAVLEHLGATALGLVGLSSAAPPLLLAKTFKSHREN
jgi:MFS family permease